MIQGVFGPWDELLAKDRLFPMQSNKVMQSSLRPVELLVLQGTPFCNLNCHYCDLSATSRRSKQVMPFELIERLFCQLRDGRLLSAELTIVWHSGEPLTLPPEYYEEAISRLMRLAQEGGSGAPRLHFDFQTNGVLIDKAWCEFFARHRHHLDLGVSCDGPADLHDRHRTNWGGRGTHAQTVRGMDLLELHGIPYNIIAVVTADTLSQPDAFYEFFAKRRKQLTGFHFNVLANGEDGGEGVGYGADDRDRYFEFFRRLLTLSRREEGEDKLQIRNFSHTLGRILAAEGEDRPRYVAEGTAPLRQLNLDALGNVTTFYAGLSVDTLADLYGDGNGFGLGNLNQLSLSEMLSSDKLERMINDFAVSTRYCETNCDYFDVCTGGFEITKRLKHGRFDAGETIECATHVKTLIDAMIADISEHLEHVD
ncbi:radical SAM protein [Sphingobium sp. B2]|uniref:radical SAM protein n=1 Tax=Sphingobium sp. B2 TaxID=2583228 RepID=UPI00119F665E|nr:radical SAM protein [Sphingobium sp. B2]